ncbi:DUF2004 domain-containing protein [Acaryochloris sp. CCMEE 5410]|uniref:DUF2004 domain-containing protein n=1 Tax=Acaryochloris sp. CCMEE 5410 TaxID=310037 RepID=UPI0005842E90|nr:DUF2004 domain-containing protein [Acaryochloris sp. CCMEE 5410]KAI9130694.1 DUF2004 domain-containing protein [Acaryochloris sp. CCMEE 5410]
MFEIPYFGKIDHQNLPDYLETKIQFDEKPVELDLNFEISSLEEVKLHQIKVFLSLLPQNIRIAQKYLNHLAKDDELIVEYFECHQDLIKDYGLRLELGTLVLMRVGIYPSNECYSVFDFTFPNDLSDRFLSVMLNHDSSLIDITHES